MKTREELQNLKRQWGDDPCWDLEETEGFEEYRDELMSFVKNHRVTRRKEEMAENERAANAFGVYRNSVDLDQFGGMLNALLSRLDEMEEELRRLRARNCGCTGDE